MLADDSEAQVATGGGSVTSAGPRKDGSHGAFDLEYILNPHPLTTFLSDHWEQAPLAIRRRDPNFFQSLFTLRDIDHILNASTIRQPDIRVLKDGAEFSLSSVLGSFSGRQHMASEAVYQHYRDGCTLSFVFLHERWNSLKELCRRLGENMSVAAQVNAYLTPPNSQGFHTHYDDHDVFVLQIAGSKSWRVFEAPYALPLVGPRKNENPAQGNLLCEVVLEQGDTLYIPRGFMHDASTNENTSLHLTVGVHPVLWGDVFLAALKSLTERDVRMRASLPLGFARDDTRFEEALEAAKRQSSEWYAMLDFDEALRQARDSVALGIAPRLEGHLLDLDRMNSFSDETVVRRRLDVPFEMANTDEAVTLHFHGKRLQFPPRAATDLAFVSRATSFTAIDLPGPLDSPGRHTLIRRLIKEGFLTFDGNRRDVVDITSPDGNLLR
jgi:ribosomal protein L16 Arg81 hydroxylase